jgi:DNA-binding beta-propeller fold protein YncE
MRPAVPTALLLAGGLAACAHAGPPPVERATQPVTWPAGERARARWVTSLPAPAAVPSSWWSRAGAAILGLRPASDASAAASLRRPFGLAVSEAGLAVADPDAPGVFLISAAGALSPLTCAGHEWAQPMAVAAAPGLLVVADAGAGLLLRLATGEAAGERACREIGRGALRQPVGVALAGDRVYAVDSSAHELVVFALDGRELARFGGRGETGAGLNFPVSVAAAPDGSLLVVDALNFRVARFSPEGELLGAIGGPPDSPSALLRPKGVAVAADGSALVSDADRDAILLFRADGSFECAIGSSGNGPAGLAMPAGLAVDGRRLYVADAMNGRNQVFELLGEST